MSDSGYTARAISDLPTLWDGFAKLVRAGLDVKSFGVNIMDLPPDYATQAHDETETGQEELYMALSGSGAVVIGDERVPLDPERMVRVDPATERVLASGPDGLRALIIGGVPGGVYEALEWSSEGE